MFKTHFFGNEISSYGKEHGFVDYATLSKAFDAVMSNDIISKTESIGYWELENGDYGYYEFEGERLTESEREDKLEELENAIEETEDENEIEELQNKIDELENASYYEDEVFQWFIISSNGAEILKEYTNEIVYYNEELHMYVWGVTHWGTAWDYVLTDIPCEKSTD